jgi:hypothetical protein
MITYSPDKDAVKQLVLEAESILGEVFVRMQLEPQSEIDRFKRHPLSKYRSTLFRLLEETEGNRITNFYFDAIEYIVFCARLVRVRNAPNLEDILKDVKNYNSFFNGYYELIVLADFLSREYEIRKVGGSCNRNDKKSGRVPDFAVLMKNGDVYIECKNIENYRFGIEKFWWRLSERISRLAIQRKRTVDFKLALQSPRLDGTISDSIFNEVEECLNAKSVFSITKTKSFLFNLSSCPIDSFEEFVESNFDIRYDHKSYLVKRTIEQVRKARKQLPSTGPGIVFINLPLTSGNDFIDLVDMVFDPIYKLVNNNTGRISRVVLTAQIRDSGGSPIDQYLQIIPNNNARYGLPSSFSLESISSDELSIDFERESCGFSVTCGEFENWHRNTAEKILLTSKDHGACRFQLWKRWDRRLRL